MKIGSQFWIKWSQRIVVCMNFNSAILCTSILKTKGKAMKLYFITNVKPCQTEVIVNVEQ